MSGDGSSAWYHLEADVHALSGLRYALTAHLRDRVAPQRLEWFVLAVHEAAASVIQHSARDATDAVAITAHTDGDVVEVVVGAARPWRATLEATDGLSYQLMVEGADEVTFAAGEDRSTVRLTLHTAVH